MNMQFYRLSFLVLDLFSFMCSQRVTWPVSVLTNADITHTLNEKNCFAASNFVFIKCQWFLLVM